jgi:hypothetical protein
VIWNKNYWLILIAWKYEEMKSFNLIFLNVTWLYFKCFFSFFPLVISLGILSLCQFSLTYCIFLQIRPPNHKYLCCFFSTIFCMDQNLIILYSLDHRLSAASNLFIIPSLFLTFSLYAFWKKQTGKQRNKHLFWMNNGVCNICPDSISGRISHEILKENTIIVDRLWGHFNIDPEL